MNRHAFFSQTFCSHHRRLRSPVRRATDLPSWISSHACTQLHPRGLFRTAHPPRALPRRACHSTSRLAEGTNSKRVPTSISSNQSFRDAPRRENSMARRGRIQLRRRQIVGKGTISEVADGLDLILPTNEEFLVS